MAVDSKKIKAAKIVQAYCRGFLLRKQIKHVQKEFEEIVTEIEGEDMKINWPQGKFYSRPVFLPNVQEKNPLSRKEGSNIQSSHNLDSELSEEKSNRMNCKVRCKNCSDSVSQSSTKSLPKPVVNPNCKTADISAISVSQETGSQLSNDETNNNKVAKCSLAELEIVRVASDGETSTDTVKVTGVTHKREKKQRAKENESPSPSLSQADEVFLCSTPMPSTENKQTGSRIPDTSRLFLKNSDIRQDKDMPSRGMQVLTESWMTDHSFEPVSDECETHNLRRLTRSELQERKEKLSMELLWIQQAVGSRKNYLRLKKSMQQSSNS